MSEAIAGGKLSTLERRRMSWENYLALPEHPRTEWVDGEVVVTPGASWPHQRASRRLANHLEVHLPPEYASAGIAHYWVVDLEDPSIDVSANVDGR